TKDIVKTELFLLRLNKQKSGTTTQVKTNAMNTRKKVTQQNVNHMNIVDQNCWTNPKWLFRMKITNGQFNQKMQRNPVKYLITKMKLSNMEKRWLKINGQA